MITGLDVRRFLPPCVPKPFPNDPGTTTDDKLFSRQSLVGQSHDSSIVLRFEMISRARSWFIFSNTGCDAKRATTLPGISY